MPQPQLLALLPSIRALTHQTQLFISLIRRFAGSCAGEFRPLWRVLLPQNQMATVLASVDSRTTVRCDICLLVQFPASNNACRRCHVDLDAVPESVLKPEPAPAPSVPDYLKASDALPDVVRELRLRRGWSQRRLASRMCVPRTYVSKIENHKATPTLSTLEALARALEVTVAELVISGERNRAQEIRELLSDSFVAEIAKWVGRLTPEDRAMVLDSTVAQLRQRQRRTA
jgi:transcriptional regulator with XRE-family HTH domain